KFIEVTHEKYRQEIGDEFGKSVPGIFTDEPNYLHCGAPNMAPWTEAFPELFQKRFQYDIREHLLEIFCELEEYEFSRARLDYRKLATDLYVNSFSKQIGEWCERNHMQMTGHDLAEDNVESQTRLIGAAMPFYEYMQAPGIDLLTEHWGIFVTAKQCTSMAHQFGRKTRLSETYGCTGWDFPFAGHKALGDWQFACGINLRCMHLAWYSMEAEAKRDYPASISYQSPWWKSYSVVEDYFARLGAALSEGEEVRKLLVIHPIESTWGVFAPYSLGRTPHCGIDDEPVRLIREVNAILAENIDFDFGDESVMSRHARLDDGGIRINQAVYRAVLLPHMRTIRKTTLDLLASFAKKGGKVCYFGNPPKYLDGVASAEPSEVYRSAFEATDEAGFSKVVASEARVISIASAGSEVAPALSILRRAEDHETLFICNYGTDFRFDQMNYGLVRDRKLTFPDVTVTWQNEVGDKVFELDLESGAIRPVAAEKVDGKLVLKTSLEEIGSRCFIATDAQIATAPALTEKKCCTRAEELPANDWRVELDDPNVVVLDHAAWFVNGEKKGDHDYFFQIDDNLRELLGEEKRGGAMIQPWLRDKSVIPARQLDLKLEYSFRCESIPSAGIYLGIERPELYTIEVNGVKLEQQEQGWWCDRSMRKLAIPAAMLRNGANRITCLCRYHVALPGLEMVYLLGDFGVKEESTLIAPVRTLSLGDWTKQGLANYAGNLTYRRTVECDGDGRRVVLRIGEWRGVSLGISVNNSKEVLLPWPPYELDVTKLLVKGANEIAVKVYGSRRNSHGPFYLETKWPNWTGPAQFKSYDQPVRQLVPSGILGSVELVRPV
ncbi:MAG: glycosyl hydrolase, partial [Victivallaceae bacterium]|nr:glycosyl hydrolase [Victivallaceae bacterium]